jgi:hypothetical protein
MERRWRRLLRYLGMHGAQILEALIQAGAIAEKRNTFPDDPPCAVAAKHQQGRVRAKLWELKQASEFSIENATEWLRWVDAKPRLNLILSTVRQNLSIKLFDLASASKNAPTML